MITTLLEIGLSNALVASGLALVAVAVTRRMRPQLALAVWMLVLAKLLMPPLWTAPLGSLKGLLPVEEPDEFVIWSEPEFPPASVPLADTPLPMDFDMAAPVAWEQAESGEAVPPLSLSGVVFAIWSLGVALWCGLAVRRVRAFGALVRQTRVAPADLQRDVERLASSLKLREAPEVRLTGRRIAPLVWGFGRRGVLLLPSELWRELSGDERETLLLHELTHLRRRDHLSKLLELAAVAVYWWLPTAWWVRRQADRATERCCDAEVVARLPERSRAYASALVKTIDFLSEQAQPLPLGASGFSQFGLVSRRIEMILKPLPASGMPWKLRLALLAIGACVFPISVESLWAEPPRVDCPAAASYREEADGLANLDKPSEPGPTAPPEIESLWKFRVSNLFSQANLIKAREECAELEAAGDTSVQSQAKRRDALRKQLAALEKACAADTVTVDQVLKAQRKLAEAETALARAVCDKTLVGRERLLQCRFAVAADEIDRTTRIWESVRQRAGTTDKGESTEVAQVREQFLHFEQEIREVVSEAYSVPAFEPNAEILRYMLEALDQDKVAATDRRIYPIKGSPTSSNVPQLDPPSDDELLIVFRAKCCDDRRPFPTGSIRIVKQRIATYNDPPVRYPAIGAASISHTLFKCTMHFEDSVGQASKDTMYVDHHHPRQGVESASTPSPDMGKSTPTAPDGGGSFVLCDGNVKDWNGTVAELLGSEVIQQAKAELARLETSDEPNVARSVQRRDAARREVERAEREFEAGKVPIERLLKAQQELSSAEASLVEIICPATTEGNRLRFQAQLLLANDALNRARRTWQEVYARYRTGDSRIEVGDEAQAREQFYRFKVQSQNVLKAMQEQSVDPESQTRRFMLGERDKVSIAMTDWRVFPALGPITVGGEPKVGDPPSDDEVIRALYRKRFDDGRSPPGENLRIAKELIATYVDPPQFFPLVGRASLHHAHYKCTVHSDDARGNPVAEVVYVDHNHLHCLTEPANQAQHDAPEAKRSNLVAGEHLPNSLPQIAKVAASDETKPEAARSRDKFDSKKEPWKVGISSAADLIEKDIFEAKAKSLAGDTKTKSALAETHANRRKAAAIQVAAMESAFESGTVKIHQLLEAQRRHSEAQAVYYRTILQSDSESDEHRRLLHEANVVVAKDALNSARRTWHKVYAKYRKNSSGSEASVEAQAREQYYQFKSQFEQVRQNYEQELERQATELEETSSVSEDQPNAKQVDSASSDEIQSGPFRFTLPRGVRKQRVQLASEKAKLADEVEAAVRRLEMQAALDRAIEFFVGPER